MSEGCWHELERGGTPSAHGGIGVGITLLLRRQMVEKRLA